MNNLSKLFRNLSNIIFTSLYVKVINNNNIIIYKIKHFIITFNKGYLYQLFLKFKNILDPPTPHFGDGFIKTAHKMQVS